METKHEIKTCGRCAKPFECKVGNITQCQCYGIEFSEQEKTLVGINYTDCLCRNCLEELKKEARFKPYKDKLRYILSLIKPKS